MCEVVKLQSRKFKPRRTIFANSKAHIKSRFSKRIMGSSRQAALKDCKKFSSSDFCFLGVQGCGLTFCWLPS